MQPNRWLIVTLIISWMLNIALGIVVFTRVLAPPCPPPHIGAPGEHPLRGRPPIGPRMRDRLRDDFQPLSESHRALSAELAELLAAEELDTGRVRMVADSLITLRSTMQRNIYRNMLELHDSLPYEQRRELYREMLGRTGWKNKHQENKQYKSKTKSEKQ